MEEADAAARAAYEDVELARRLARADPARRLRHADMLALLDQALRSLGPRMEKVLRMRFGLDPYSVPLSLREVGKEFNLQYEAIRRIQDRAARKLRQGTRREWLSHAARSIGLTGKWPPAPDEPVRHYQPPNWSKLESSPTVLLPVMQPLPELPAQPDAIEVLALTQDMPAERFAEILTPRALPPIGEMENLARKLGLPRERLHATRLRIPPHWHWHVEINETGCLHGLLRLTLSAQRD